MQQTRRFQGLELKQKPVSSACARLRRPPKITNAGNSLLLAKTKKCVHLFAIERPTRPAPDTAWSRKNNTRTFFDSVLTVSSYCCCLSVSFFIPFIFTVRLPFFVLHISLYRACMRSFYFQVHKFNGLARAWSLLFRSVCLSVSLTSLGRRTDVAKRDWITWIFGMEQGVTF